MKTRDSFIGLAFVIGILLMEGGWVGLASNLNGYFGTVVGGLFLALDAYLINIVTKSDE